MSSHGCCMITGTLSPSIHSSMDAPAPDPSAADYWVNSWNIYLATGSVHSVRLIQLSVFLKHKQSTPIKHMGRSHVGADRWVKPQSCRFSPPSDLGWISWVGWSPREWYFQSSRTYGYRYRYCLLGCELSSSSHLPCLSIFSQPIGLTPFYPASTWRLPPLTCFFPSGLCNTEWFPKLV